MAEYHDILAGDCGSMFVQMNGYNQKLQSVTKLCPGWSFPTKQPFWLGYRVLWVYWPVDHSPVVSIDDCPVCSPSQSPFTSDWGRLGPVYDLWTCPPAVLAGKQRSVGNSESLTTHTGKYSSTRHTWAKGFLLIKNHLEQMTSTRLPCLSMCSSLSDLFCVWKLNS